MAESLRPDLGQWGPQNTGNPVLDSVVNIICTRLIGLEAETIGKLHAGILAIAMKEPGGLKVSPHLQTVD